MIKVRLRAHSYERYQRSGDRTSLKEYRQGDVFEADGPELDRLLDLEVVEDASGDSQSQVSERAKADHDLAVTRHEAAKVEHDTLVEQPNQAKETIERSAMNVEALRGERDRLGRLARRSDVTVPADPPAKPAVKT